MKGKGFITVYDNFGKPSSIVGVKEKNIVLCLEFLRYYRILKLNKKYKIFLTVDCFDQKNYVDDFIIYDVFTSWNECLKTNGGRENGKINKQKN